MNFEQRCNIAAACLPRDDYRASLERLHAEMLAAIADAAKDSERIAMLHRSLEDDGYGHWSPDWCIKEGDTPPTLDEFRAFIDAATKGKP